MPFPTLDRLGVRNFAGTQPVTTAAEYELFKKEYTVDIIKRFNEKIVFANRLMKRQIASGTGASFPLTGKTTARYHIPGVSPDLTGTNGLPQSEKTINVDRPIVSDIMVHSVDELMAHVDVRAERSKQMADALVRKMDQNLARLVTLTSRASALVTGSPTGGKIYIADIDTDPEVLATAILRAVAKLATNEVPLDFGEVSCVLPTAQYFALLETDTIVHMDYNNSSGGTSPIRTGKVPTIAGCPIDYSPNIPSTNITEAEAGVDPGNTYHGNFTTTQGLVFHRSCVGSVQLMDIKFEQEYSVAKQGTLFVAKMMVGSGYLRPEAAVELSSDNS